LSFTFQYIFRDQTLSVDLKKTTPRLKVNRNILAKCKLAEEKLMYTKDTAELDMYAISNEEN